MPRDFKFDPVTQDLVKDGKGGYVMVETAETAVQEQLLAHFEECWHSPRLGSRLHRLELFKADPANLIPDEARRALEVLQEDGLIDNIETRAELVTGRGRVNVATRVRDRSSNQVVDTYVKPGG